MPGQQHTWTKLGKLLRWQVFLELRLDARLAFNNVKPKDWYFVKVLWVLAFDFRLGLDN